MSSLNRAYRIVWNVRLELWQAVAEIARGCGKGVTTRASNISRKGRDISRIASCFGNDWPRQRRRLVHSAILLLAASAVHAAPQGGQVVTGQATISQSGTTTLIQQGSDRAAINWQGFSTATNESVRFAQPGSSAVTLNRVVGNETSQLLGSLTANGQVFILNPNGVLIGKNAEVSTGGLLVSTLGMSNTDFMAGRYQLSGVPDSTAAIVNQGIVQANGSTGNPGGYIALVAPHIINTGTLQAGPTGQIHLTAASDVLVSIPQAGPIQLQINQGVIDALIDNGGAIRAEGGVIHLTAQGYDQMSQAVVNHSGVIEATTTATNERGEIVLVADLQTGTTRITGSLDASAPHVNTDGGFIETSGKSVAIADGARITTHAVQGRSGEWLLDPDDLTIAASGGNITGSALSAALGNTSVTLKTSSGAATCTGATCTSIAGGNGDIFVNDTVTWSQNTLTLSAWRNISINQVMNGSGTAQLALEYGQNAVKSGNTATYNVNAPVNLPAGNNFSLKLGNNGTTDVYTVITSLGAAGSTTGTDLQGMNGNLSGKYVLGTDIDASGTATWDSNAGFLPVGISATPFTGVFDGLGHTVNNLSINRSTNSDVGLFGATNNAVIRNIGLAGGSIIGQSQVGGLIGSLSGGSINNAYATGTVSGFSNIGGLVGYQIFGGSISNVFTTGAISGSGTIGGLVGYLGSGSISNAYATGAVTGSGNSVGGLVAYQAGGSINNAYATGAVQGYRDVGGLVGFQAGSAASISNAYATGVVTGNLYAGGLLGRQTGGSVGNSYWDKDTTRQSVMCGSATGSGCDNSKFVTSSTALTQAPYVGFDFTNTWFISAGNTRPMLRPQKDGSGTYVIRDVYQLQAMAGNLGGSYILAGNIDASAIKIGTADADLSGVFHGKGFVPVGGWTTLFTGSFDGLGHTINNLTIDRPTTDYVGLFSATSNAVIRNVSLVGGSVKGNYVVGGLVGYQLDSTISHVYTTGAVTGTNYTGGLVGFQTGSSVINDACTTGAVTGSYFVGGLVAYQNNGSISNAYTTGSVTGDSNVGGLVGEQDGGSISAAYTTGSVAGNYNNVGGLVGYLQRGSISNAHAAGSITGVSEAGGLVGYQNGGSISNSHAAGSVTGSYSIGGLVGDQHGGSINDVYATGVVTGSDSIGGLVGYQYDSSISNAYATGTVTGDSSIGGLVGYQDWNGNISNAYAIGEVTGTSRVGGLVGTQYGGSINNAYATGDVKGDSRIGGLVGYQRGSDGGDSSISNAYATGAVTGVEDVGGLVGFQRSTESGNSTIRNAYATGAVTGDYNVGGLVGHQYSDYGISIIDNAYATGLVTGNATVAGLVGYQENGSISNAYFDTTTTGTSQGVGTSDAGTSDATGLATADMRKAASFSGWSIDSVGGGSETWRIYEDATAPLLKAFLTPQNVTIASDSKTYNGQNQTSGTGYTATGADLSKISGDLNGGGRNVGSYTISGTGLYSSQQGYDLIFTNGILTIAKASLTLAPDAVTKTYDGTVNATGAAVATGGTTLYGTDTLSTGTVAFADKNAGNNKTVTIANVTVNDGNGGNNYAVTYQSTASGTISPAILSVSGLVAQNKTYDGTTNASLAGGTLTGILGSDSVSLASNSAAFADKNVGTTKAVTISGLALSGIDAANYTVATPTGLAADITPKALSLAAVSDSKTYDGTTASGGTITVSGLVAGDALGNLVQAFDSKNAGSRTLSVQNGFSLTDSTSADMRGNYSISTSTASGTISPATLSLSGLTASNKVYDGNTNASLAGGTLAGVIGSDAVSLSGGSGSFADKNVGTAKAVTVSGLSLAGADAGNYSVATPTGLTADITAKTLSVTGLTAGSKVYDGNTNASLAGGTLTGVIGSDAVSLSGGSGNFADKNVGSAKAVSVSSLSLAGADAGNYSVATPAGLTADITAKALSVTGLSATSKVYDGNTNASLAGGTLAGVIGSDAVSLSGGSGSFADKNVGSAKAVTVSGLTLTGAGAANYTVATPTGLAADITPKALSLAAVSDSKTYDGTTASGGTITVSGLVAGDALGNLVQAFDSKNAGSRTLSVQNGFSLTDSTSADMRGNYSISTSTASGTISPATLTLSGLAGDRYVMIRCINGLPLGSTCSQTQREWHERPAINYPRTLEFDNEK